MNTIASGSTGTQRSASRPRGSASAARAASKLGKSSTTGQAAAGLQRRGAQQPPGAHQVNPDLPPPALGPEPAQEWPTPTGPHGGYGPRPPTRAPATPHRYRNDAATPHANAAAPPPQHDRHRPERSRWARPDQPHPRLDPRHRPPESPTSSSLLGVHDRHRMFVAKFETVGHPGRRGHSDLPGRGDGGGGGGRPLPVQQMITMVMTVLPSSPPTDASPCGGRTPMRRIGTPTATARPPGKYSGRITGTGTSPVRSKRVGVGEVVWVEHAARNRAPRPPARSVDERR